MKLKKIFALSAAALMLAGCGNGETTIPDGSEVIMTVGDKKITKGTEYTLVKDYYGPSMGLTLANRLLYDKEIGRPEDVVQEAQEQLDDYASSEGFEDQIKAIGFDSLEDYRDTALVPGVQSTRLQEKYFTDAKEEIIQNFDPVLAVIIQTDSEDNANKALEELKNGQDAGKVGAQYAADGATYTGTEQIVSTADTTLPTTLLNAIQDATKDGVLDQVFTNDTSTDDKEYYVASVVSMDYDKNLKKIISALSSNQTIQSDCQVYYLKKYEFEVHDQFLFDYYKANNPEYLVTRPDLAEAASEDSSAN